MIHLYRSGRADLLAGRLAEMLLAAPLDPMAAEWIGVPAEGMRRWLLLELARHLGASDAATGDGVATNIALPFPASLRVRVLDADRDPGQEDPWELERLTWTVLEVAHANATDPALSSFSALAPGASRYGKARRVADLFDRYHVHRPEMIRRWARGDDVDAAGRRIAPHHRWQAHLWRLVNQRIAEECPPVRLDTQLSALRAGVLDVALPERISLFGLTSVPGGQTFLEICQALSLKREVHLFLLEPAHFPYEALVDLDSPSGPSGQRFRLDDTSGALAQHPLLSSWGRPHREGALLLADSWAPDGVVVETVPQRPEATRATNLLSTLQDDISANRAPSGSLRIDAPDSSVEFHACHGETRQVEVLRDAILHLLARPDSDLIEDDILVICPALERFAPLVEAVFGPSAEVAASGPDDRLGSPRLRYRIADRSVRDTNPVLSAMAALIDLVDGRFDASSVIDFLTLAPVRLRFDFDDDDVAVISEWVQRSDIRWGLTPLHRKSFGVPESVMTNTWQAGLDRLLVGSAVFDNDLGLAVGDVAIVGVEGNDVETLGRMADLLFRLEGLVEAFSAVRPISEWIALLRECAASLFSVPADLTWQSEALSRALADVEESASTPQGSCGVPLDLADVRRAFGERLRSAPGRPDFFRGGITVTSMKPLRGIAYRVVCVLGADEPGFSSGSADGDDLTLAAPIIGDPDLRAEDRQALLEALLAARDHFIVVRDGHDVRTNKEVKPAVVLDELRDCVLASVHPDDRAGLLGQLETAHPRQAFDERSFVTTGDGANSPWGFSEIDKMGALARRARVDSVGPFLEEPLDDRRDVVIELAALQGFLKHPVTWFMTERLEARLPRNEEARRDQLPVVRDALDNWKLGQSLLSARLSGRTTDQWARIERARGSLPPATLGDALVDELSRKVTPMVEATTSIGFDQDVGQDVAIDVIVGDGTRIVGTVRTHLAPPRAGPVTVMYSTYRAEHELAAWLDLMALIAAAPETDWRSYVINRKGTSTKKADVHRIVPRAGGAAGQAAALTALSLITDLYRRGMTEPLPFFPSLSKNVYAHKPAIGDWLGGDGSQEDNRPATDLAYGHLDFDGLMAVAARPGDPPGPGGRVERFARSVFGALEATVEIGAPTESDVSA